MIQVYGLSRNGKAFAYALLLVGSARLLGAEGNAEPPSVFAPAQDVTATVDDATLRARGVSIDLAQLGAAAERALNRPAGTETQMPLTLNLFEDVVLRGVVEHRVPTASGFAITGSIEGVYASTMTIVVNDDIVVGEIHTIDTAYILRTVGDGRYVVREVDLATRQSADDDYVAFPNSASERLDLLQGDGIDDGMLPDATPPPVRQDGFPRSRGRDPDSNVDNTARALSSTCAAVGEERSDVVDLLVAYTTAARNEAGGARRIRAGIDMGVAYLKAALKNSGAQVGVRLVGTTETSYAQTAYATVHLDRLDAPADGHMDELHATRDACRADLVHLILADAQNSTSWAGYAYGLGSFVGWTEYGHLGSGVFAHEIGHNFGLNHDRYQYYVKEHKSGSTANEHGYVNRRALDANAPTNRRWRTVMSYEARCADAGISCVQLQRFANPRYSYGGDRMGVAGDQRTSRVDGPADAVRTINQNGLTIANYRVNPSRLIGALGDSLTMRILLDQHGAGVSARQDPVHGGGSAPPQGSTEAAQTPVTLDAP